MKGGQCRRRVRATRCGDNDVHFAARRRAARDLSCRGRRCRRRRTCHAPWLACAGGQPGGQHRITRCVSRAAGGITGIEERSNAHHYTPTAAGVGGDLRKRSRHILWLVHAHTSHRHHTRTHIANITNQHRSTRAHITGVTNASRTMQSAKCRRTRMRPSAGTGGAIERRWQGGAGADEGVG